VASAISGTDFLIARRALSPPFFMRSFIVSITAFCFLSCSNNQADSKATAAKDALDGETIHSNAKDTIATHATPMVVAGCYEMVFKKDSAELSINVKDTVVTGTLNFNLYEKDKNKGMIKGVLRDDMIFADYTFQSEGMSSVREVVFKVEDGTLVQAFGDMEERKNKLVFTDKDHLQFQKANPFIKTDCPL
jgi:hypothetical protein